MIVVRAPLRISFVGGGTDLPDFYRLHGGSVISSAIDKYIYLVIHHTPLTKAVRAYYAEKEVVNHARELTNARIREALLDLGIHNNIEITSLSHVPGQTGLGGSSSFSVALVKGLHAYQGKKIGGKELAEAACRLEIDILKEPIGKQDQYATAVGGFHVYRFHPDDTVTAEPVFLDYVKRMALEDHMLLFFTGTTRLASGVLREQRQNIPQKIATLKDMASSVQEFREHLLAGNFPELGRMLRDGWERKKTLASGVSNPLMDDIYTVGMARGVWGGKVLGAGGGGCMMFLAPLEKKEAIREGMREYAAQKALAGFQEIPVHFVQTGAQIVFNDDRFSKF